ncbi:MAG: hypothetical protein OJF49_002905 [Ktedonobacterales bacterium]|nr:MAG: hypothetical protein OJF49_002905 [Ktedonobacterales bacterium]
MAKLRCLCGAVIVEQGDYVPLSSVFIAPEDWENASDEILDMMMQMMDTNHQSREDTSDATEAPPHEDSARPAPVRLEAGAVGAAADAASVDGMYTCAHCGRHWMQTPIEPRYVF